MTTIEKFLDSKFTDLNSLRNELDKENAAVKENELNLVDTIRNTRNALVEDRQSQIRSLTSEFEELALESAIDLENKKSNISGLVESIGDIEVADVVERKVSRMTDLLAASKLIGLLKQLNNTTISSTEDLSNDLKHFQQVALLEKQVAVYTHSANAAIRQLASERISLISVQWRKPLQKRTGENLREFLKKSEWPNEIRDSELFNSFFSASLAVENPLLSGVSTPAIPVPLESFRILAEAFSIRFRFHFETNRPTNRPDKVEWLFKYVINFIDEHTEFLDNVAQKAILGENDPVYGSGRIALHEFIVAILDPIRNKLHRLFAQVRSSPALLCHTIYETLAFDNLLKERYFFTPYGYDKNAWRGLSGYLLAHDDLFNTWLDVEKTSALARFTEIIESPNAWDIDWDAVENHMTKPTISSILIKDLLEGVTERYNRLGSVKYRLKFLLETQISILDRYFERLTESLDAFESMSSRLARAVGGISAENAKLVSRLAGLERLCKVYGSIRYIQRSLEKWGQDLFFVELWEDISRMSKKNSDGQGKVTIPDNEEDEGTLFDETIASYEKLRLRTATNTTAVMKKEIQSSMKDYFRSTGWSDITIGDLQSSSDLKQPILTLSKLLAYLSKFHSPNEFLRFTKQIAKDLQRLIFNYIVQSNQFNQGGGQQLAKDIDEIWSSLSLPRDSSLKFIEEVCKILGGDKHAVRQEPEIVKKTMGLELSTEEIKSIQQRRSDL